MAEQPPKSDEDIANAAMQDIYTNVTSARESWRDYDMRYALQRILRAIREAKEVMALALCLIPVSAMQEQLLALGRPIRTSPTPHFQRLQAPASSLFGKAPCMKNLRISI
jgi:hypothetical protein